MGTQGPKPVLKDAAAALLCGGRSSRMGFDKAFLGVGEESLLLANARKLSSVFGRVYLVADSKDKLLPLGDLSGYALLEDQQPGMGPMGGVAAALAQAEEPYVFVMACDMPSPDLELIYRLHETLGDAQVALFEHEGKLEPLFAFYHRSCLPVFREQLQQGNTQLRREFHRLRVRRVPLDEAHAQTAFLNLNTPEEVELWRRKRQ